MGSIPFALIIGQLHGVDIRRHGSGNVGATNAFRILGPIPGSLVFVLDMLKGSLPVYLAALSLGFNAHLPIILVGTAAILGHMFPVYLNFKGGRGVATSAGVLLVMAPDLLIVTLLIFATSLILSRYVSVSSLTAVTLLTLLMFRLKRPLIYSVLCLLVAILIYIRHIPNIRRLLAGQESRIGEKPKA